MFKMDIGSLLKEAVDRCASDLHLTVGLPPIFRKNGAIMRKDAPFLTEQETELAAKELMTEKQYNRFMKRGELDFSYALSDISRFRINLFRQRGSIALSIRVIPFQILTLDQLGHPNVIKKLIHNTRGLVLVTGPTGSGKTTTLAAMVDYINSERSCHILTLEDPIEYLHKHKKSMLNQREINTDSKSFSRALRAGLREDPDVILIGEMRDIKTISIAITAAETGHLVLATLHTGDASQTIDRIIDVFPASKQQQIRMQLSMSLQGVISQQLVPRQDGSGRIAAFEILTATSAIRNLIRQGQTHQILSTILQGKQHGMIDMDTSLKTLYLQGIISYEEAVLRVTSPDKFKR
jgi:twitching motility protein PilT